ncbi:hypothetical protein Enr10x_53920 [Gimesia panareensis]|uniref:Uncharacterized protein n=1 Tax=Gimesia panareensis TaxID=2527978 RepID=A0A517QEG9_9PLAN|nr:phospholipase D family protein [Gimesia panareensis]QDT30033.1 hypothetical protein Enr10x_53920 [Gimesia panareensis]
MKLLTTANEINDTLYRLVKQCQSCQIAVAWASTGTKPFERLRDHQDKIERMVVGTHFYQTDPSFIEAFMQHANVRFVRTTDGVFHPKMYFFWLQGESWACVVGSPNFTAGGLGGNEEVATLITDADDGADEALAQITSAISRYWQLASPITDKQLEAYRQAWRRKKPVLKRLRGKFGIPDDDSDDSGKPPLDVPILTKTWEQFFNEVKSEKDHHTLPGRLDVIRGTRALFAEYHQFQDIDQIGRRKIAGLIDDADAGVNYLWFGSMKGAGKFWKAINDNDPHLSSAIDLIPATGVITRDVYLAYIDEYRRAFPEGRHGIATATRLLAMKRPDYFVCFDARNEEGLCDAFGISRNVGYEVYWDSVIERIVESSWWNVPCPQADQERDVWLARAAFLDSLYYDGKGL